MQKIVIVDGEYIYVFPKGRWLFTAVNHSHRLFVNF